MSLRMRSQMRPREAFLSVTYFGISDDKGNSCIHNALLHFKYRLRREVTCHKRRAADVDDTFADILLAFSF